MAKKQTIGFVGLGIMGLAMAQNAKKAGFPVVVTNRSLTRRKAAEKAGLKVLATPHEVAAKSEAVVIMVTDPAAVRDVLLGSQGVFSAAVKGKTLIQCSTLDEKSTLNFADEAANRKMNFLDAPVTGSKKQVQEAQLIFLIAGEDDLLEKWRSLFMTMGKTIVHAGPIGKGTVLKLCMNLIVAQMTTALCESTALAKVGGVEPEKIFEVLKNSPALNCGYYQIKEKPLLQEDFSPAFSLANMLKDVRFMSALAKEKRLMLPVNEAVRYLMESAMSENLADKDLTAIAEILKPKVVVN